jgi:hypothetical protein
MKQILEKFEGFLDKIIGNIGYVTLKTGNETLWIEIPVSELQRNGIKERRNFYCCTVKENSEIRLELQSIPDKILSPEELIAIEKEINLIPNHWNDQQEAYS